jgi:hypothetical protein
MLLIPKIVFKLGEVQSNQIQPNLTNQPNKGWNEPVATNAPVQDEAFKPFWE